MTPEFRSAQKSQMTQQTAFSQETCPQPAAENIIGPVCERNKAIPPVHVKPTCLGPHDKVRITSTPISHKHGEGVDPIWRQKSMNILWGQRSALYILGRV